MKTFLLLLLTLNSAFALPVLNQNAAGIGSKVIIWPDHADPNHFYFAPSSVGHAAELGAGSFSFIEYTNDCNRFGRNCQKKGLLNAILKAQFDDANLLAAQEQIRKLKPQARFAVVPMFNGRVEFNQSLTTFIAHHSCSPNTAQANDLIPCSLTLNSRGLRTIKPMLLEGDVLPLKFNYQISGVQEIEGKKYVDATIDLGLAVQLGGEVTLQHPDLL